jgi:hypothetical protein
MGCDTRLPHDMASELPKVCRVRMTGQSLLAADVHLMVREGEAARSLMIQLYRLHAARYAWPAKNVWCPSLLAGHAINGDREDTLLMIRVDSVIGRSARKDANRAGLKAMAVLHVENYMGSVWETFYYEQPQYCTPNVMTHLNGFKLVAMKPCY